MRIAVAESQINRFHDLGWIELEDCLPQTMLSSYLEIVNREVAKQSFTKMIESGHNLRFRSDDASHLNRKPLIPTLAAAFSRKKRLRLLSEQAFALHETIPSGSVPAPFQSPRKLSSFTSFQEPWIAALFPLRIEIPEEIDEPLPKHLGNILFIDPSRVLDWSSLFKSNGNYFYLIVFGDPNAVYTRNPDDPNAHAMKKRGLEFGDRLQNDRDFPFFSF